MRRTLLFIFFIQLLPGMLIAAPYDYLVGFKSGASGYLEFKLPGTVLRLTPANLQVKGTDEADDMPLGLERGTHVLLLKQRAEGVYVFLDRRLVKRLSTVLLERCEPVVTAGGTFVISTPARVQKNGPIVFDDDFARVDLQAPLWSLKGGMFEVNAAHNPDSAQGAFQYWAHSPDGEAWAMANQSYWFWDHYRAGVTALAPQPGGAWGLIVDGEDGDHFRLEVEQASATQAGIRLVERRGGVDQELASVDWPLRTGQWQRAEIVTTLDQISAYVNGRQVCSLKSDHLAGGKVGLYLRNMEEVLFDDVSVRSVGDAAAEHSPFGPSEHAWSDFSKKSFYTDTYMVQWAHPRANWSMERSGDPGLLWFRPNLFHDAAFEWEIRAGQALKWPARVLLFSDPDRADSGYELSVAENSLALNREGVEVTSTSLTVSDLRSLRFMANRGVVKVDVNGQEVMAWQDALPLTHGRVAASLGPTRGMNLKQPDWRDTAKVTSSHRLDYDFDHAPASWEVAGGNWRPTHRWACVPKWSFFSGRGDELDPQGDPTGATLWNRRSFSGDYDLELFLAPLEGTSQRVHFTWPVGMGIAFNGDGASLDSGYFLYYSLYDQSSRLYRAGQQVAENATRVNTLLRHDAMPWYHRITQVWQHVRIRREGKKVTIDIAAHDDRGNYLGLERFFEYEDEAPLNGDRFGIWGWGCNGLAIARATISFDNSAGPATEPGAAVQSSGGMRQQVLATEPFEITREKGLIGFQFEAAEQERVSLFALIRGQVAEYVLSGPAVYRPWSIPLGSLPPEQQQVELDLYGRLREAFPDGPLRAERLFVGSPFSNVEERAGLGVNAAGSSYQVSAVNWKPSPHERSAIAKSTPAIGALADFEADLGGLSSMGGPDGARIYRDPHEPYRGKYSARLLNATVAGTAGAWLTQAPFNVEAFPKLSFAYRIPAGFELNLLVEANKRRFEIGLTAGDASWPVISRVSGITQDGAWHTADVNLLGILRQKFQSGPVQIDSLALVDTGRPSSLQAHAYWLDDILLTPAAEPPVPLVAEAPVIPNTPGAPYIVHQFSDALTYQDFEWSRTPYDHLATYGEFRARRQVWPLRCEDDGATGEGSIRLVNPNPHEFFSAYFRKSSWDPVRWPIISFDYKFNEQKCALNLSLLVDEGMTIVEWTGTNIQNYFTPAVIGRAEPANEDGQWHHVEIDLLQMIRATRFPKANPARPITAAELATWATSHAGRGYRNQLGAEVRIDNFTIASRRGRDPRFTWKVQNYPASLGGYAVAFDQQPNTEPAAKVTTQEPTIAYQGVEPGIWFLHVRAVDSRGNWGPPGHCRIEIAP